MRVDVPKLEFMHDVCMRSGLKFHDVSVIQRHEGFFIFIMGPDPVNEEVEYMAGLMGFTIMRVPRRNTTETINEI